MSDLATIRHVLVAGERFDVPAPEILSSLTGWRVTAWTPGGDVVGIYRDAVPDVVIIEAALFRSHADAMLDVRRRPIVCAGPDDHVAARASLLHGASGWVVTPASAETIATQVDVAVHWFDRVETLAVEKLMLQQTIETRKLVERAKAIFMRRLNLDEASAHRRLQQESQNRRVAIGELAKHIIESEEILAHPDRSTG